MVETSPNPAPAAAASARSFNRTRAYMEASLESARVYSMGLVSAMRRRAVSWAVNRREPRGSHCMWGKASATGEGVSIGPRPVILLIGLGWCGVVWRDVLRLLFYKCSSVLKFLNWFNSN